ncbi:MAG TPA: 2-C-methyl-D-erythritol 4-phosphate cytidylyltransferase [Ktedonobacterales bacterium]|nr:2-C-methyl-D-erythritol 4-phosphate cytidylyltransferase [Ktedonobacterales bacterium]
MLPTSDNEPIRAGAVILASASQCPVDPDLLWASLGGRPLLAWSVMECLAVAALEHVILVVAPDRMSQANALLARLVEQVTEPGQPAPGWRVITPSAGNLAARASDPSMPQGATLVAHATPDSAASTEAPTSERRSGATLAGVQALATLAPDCEWVVIHEATRPLASAALMRTGLATAGRANAGAVAAEPVRETLKRAPDGVGGHVAETLPRAQLARAQTPQVYRVADLLAVLHQLPPDADPADEATVAFAAGLPLVTYPGGHDNLRVTTRADLPILASLAPTPR